MVLHSTGHLRWEEVYSAVMEFLELNLLAAATRRYEADSNNHVMNIPTHGIPKK